MLLHVCQPRVCSTCVGGIGDKVRPAQRKRPDTGPATTKTSPATFIHPSTTSPRATQPQRKRESARATERGSERQRGRISDHTGFCHERGRGCGGRDAKQPATMPPNPVPGSPPLVASFCHVWPRHKRREGACQDNLCRETSHQCLPVGFNKLYIRTNRGADALLAPHPLHGSRRVCQHYVLHRRAGNTAQRAFSISRPIVLSAKSTCYTESIL